MKYDLIKESLTVYVGFNCLRTESSDGLLWTL